MYPFDQRRKHYQQVISQLEHDLQAQGIQLFPYIKGDKDVIERLALGKFLFQRTLPKYLKTAYEDRARVVLKYELSGIEALDLSQEKDYSKRFVPVGFIPNPDKPHHSDDTKIYAQFESWLDDKKK